MATTPPLDPQSAPDPARSYGREKPEMESGMGRLDNNQGTPVQQPDDTSEAVHNKQPNRQLNAHDVVNQRAGEDPSRPQPDHSMKDEEPMGWDQAPQEAQNSRDKRHPKKDGTGGTP